MSRSPSAIRPPLARPVATLRHWQGPLSLLLVAALSACGGGGGSSTDTAAGSSSGSGSASGGSSGGSTPLATSLAGVVAIGAPVGEATVTLSDAAGHSVSTTAAADGSYRFSDISGLTAPFQLQATGQVGEVTITHRALVPTAPSSGEATANITPLTTAVVALASPGELPATLTTAELAAITPAAVAAATERVQTAIAPLVQALGLTTSFNPTTTPFSADGQGVDRLLDHLDVSVTPEAVTLSNKMAVATDGQATTDASAQIVKADTAPPTPINATQTSNTDGFDDLAAAFRACFQVPAGQRMTVSGQTATLNPACANLADPAYRHNGVDFATRWALAFNSATMDGATFSRPVVRLRVSASPERIAINLNFRDASGTGYTKPELIERQSGGGWRLVGNGRDFNAFAEAQANIVDDLTAGTGFNNLNTSRVDTGFRLAFDPRASWDASGRVTYHGADLSVPSGYATGTWASYQAALAASSRMVGCVVVRGPGEMVGAKWSGFHPNGLLLKRPVGSSLQDYLSIDSTVTDAWRAAIDATSASATGSVSAPRVGSSTNICGAGTTSSSANSYVIDMQALGARRHVLTGEVDAGIAGRDVAWYTGARYARQSPTGAVMAALASNPPLTFEVFDTDGRLRAVFGSRFLGRLPEVGLARAFVAARQVPAFSTDSIRRYLDFSSGADTVTQTVTGSVQIDWTTPSGALGADRIGLYSEVYRATPGQGIRGPLSRANDGSGLTSSLWTSDPDLAAQLDALPGVNFYWWSGNYAQPTTTGATSCSGSSMVSTNGVNVARSATSVGANDAYGGSLYGTQALASACRGPATHALVYREMFFRTYTDQNVRLYITTANRQVRAPG